MLNDIFVFDVFFFNFEKSSFAAVRVAFDVKDIVLHLDTSATLSLIHPSFASRLDFYLNLCKLKRNVTDTSRSEFLYPADCARIDFSLGFKNFLSENLSVSSRKI